MYFLPGRPSTVAPSWHAAGEGPGEFETGVDVMSEDVTIIDGASSLITMTEIKLLGPGLGPWSPFFMKQVPPVVAPAPHVKAVHSASVLQNLKHSS